MKTWLQQIADALTTSFWFLPAVMALAAAALAVALLLFDFRFAPEQWPDWLKVENVEGLRQLLATLLGSIITVLGVLFSITIVALTLAASQLGPRLLRNFMRDRMNQTVLGVFVATYVYCLIVLFAVDRFSPAEETLPQISTIGAFFLGLASLAMLIYFIHHLARSIQAPHVLMVVAKELRAGITRSFPDKLDQPQKSAPENAHADGGSPAATELANDSESWKDAEIGLAHKTGYVQAIDLDSLMATAVKHDLQIKLNCRPGEFVAEEEALIHIMPARKMTDKIRRSLKDDVYIGSQRTATQDIEFVIQELVEVALRAVSPSINDPITAINAVDYLGEALGRIVQRHMPPQALRDDRDTVRIIINQTDFEGLCHVAFDQLRQHAASYPGVLIRMLENLTRIAGHATLPDRKQALWQNGRMILSLAHKFDEPYDRQCLTQRFSQLHQTLLPEAESFQSPAPT